MFDLNNTKNLCDLSIYLPIMFNFYFIELSVTIFVKTMHAGSFNIMLNVIIIFFFYRFCCYL